MSTVRFTINVPTDKTLAIYSALREHGVTIEGTPESEAVDSDPTPPHGTSRRDGFWAVTEERFSQLTYAEAQRDQLLTEVDELRARVGEMRDSSSDIRRERDALRSQLGWLQPNHERLLTEVVKLRARVEEMRDSSSTNDRLDRFHFSVAAAFTWLQRESDRAKSVPEVFDAAGSFIDTVRRAIDEYVREGES